MYLCTPTMKKITEGEEQICLGELQQLQLTLIGPTGILEKQ